MRHGLGKSVNRDGSVFEGQWKEDKKYGPGLMTYPDGSVLRA